MGNLIPRSSQWGEFFCTLPWQLIAKSGSESKETYKVFQAASIFQFQAIHYSLLGGGFQHGAFAKTGGFKYFLLSPLLVEMIQFEEHFFQMG